MKNENGGTRNGSKGEILGRSRNIKLQDKDASSMSIIRSPNSRDTQIEQQLIYRTCMESYPAQSQYQPTVPIYASELSVIHNKLHNINYIQKKRQEKKEKSKLMIWARGHGAVMEG